MAKLPTWEKDAHPTLRKCIERGLNESQQNQLALIFVNVDFCCQTVAVRDSDRPETLILRGSQNFSLYSHSIQSNAFRLILVSPVRSRDSDSTDYLYSPCSTASVYHFFISVIKRLFCCGLRGLFPRNHYISSECLSQSIWLVSHQTV